MVFKHSLSLRYLLEEDDKKVELTPRETYITNEEEIASLKKNDSLQEGKQ